MFTQTILKLSESQENMETKEVNDKDKKIGEGVAYWEKGIQQKLEGVGKNGWDMVYIRIYI